MTKFHDLDFKKLSDGSIRLTQDDRMDEASVIDMHPEQLLYMARQLCGMKPETAAVAKDLERKLAVLDAGIAALVLDDGIRTEIIERCGSGIEIILRLDALYDLAVEFTVGLTPDYDHPNLLPKSTPKETQSKPTGFDSLNPSQPTPPPIKTQPSATVQADGQLGLAV
jgi:hypothetical protein